MPMIDPATTLALITDLYAQVNTLAAENAQLRAAQAEAAPAGQD